MPLHNFEPLRGRVETITVASQALRDNRLGDPSSRQVAVYLPPEALEPSERRFPLLVALAGFTGSGLKLLSWQLFGENLPQRIERLAAAGAIGPMIVAMPDGFTRLGGNQYINSPILGRWEDHLLEAVLPELEQRYPVLTGAAHRAIFGKSSGGYGALMHGLRHGERWGALACHSGDIGFDIAFRRDLPVVLQTLQRHGMDLQAFVDGFDARRNVRGDELFALMFLAFAASYDPAPQRPFGVQLPMDPHTCALIAERWDRWLAHDPLELIERPEAQASLRQVGGLFLDCGFRDQYHLHYGARAFVRRLEALGIPHRYEEFDDDHSGIDYRMDVSLPFLWEKIRP